MPYKIVKVEGGYKVKKKQKGRPKYYSDHPLTYGKALAQMAILYANEK